MQRKKKGQTVKMNENEEVVVNKIERRLVKTQEKVMKIVKE